MYKPRQILSLNQAYLDAYNENRANFRALVDWLETAERIPGLLQCLRFIETPKFFIYYLPTLPYRVGRRIGCCNANRSNYEV